MHQRPGPASAGMERGTARAEDGDFFSSLLRDGVGIQLLYHQIVVPSVSGLCCQSQLSPNKGKRSKASSFPLGTPSNIPLERLWSPSRCTSDPRTQQTLKPGFEIQLLSIQETSGVINYTPGLPPLPPAPLFHQQPSPASSAPGSEWAQLKI